MSVMNGFGVRHLRSFGEDETLIPVKKINVFVGKNSCGKSTFLRTYPLLRQSVESDTRSPILWYGGYVDFGDFNTALQDGAKEVFFDFDIDLNIGDTFNWEPWLARHNEAILLGDEMYRTLVTIGLKKKDKESLCTTISFQVESAKVDLVYTGLEVISVSVTCLNTGNVEWYQPTAISSKGAIFPKDVCSYKDVTFKNQAGMLFKRRTSVDVLHVESLSRMTKYLHGFHHRSKQIKNIRSLVQALPLSSGENLIDRLRELFHRDKFFIKKLDENSSEIADYCFQYLLANRISHFWTAADRLLEEFYGGVRYLGPLRATAERFYRHQDLQIGEVDHTGSNLTMVINSLDSRSKRELSDWVFGNFGFNLELEASGLHYALKIKEEHDDRFHNLSDMGFGYSQILPVIVSMWLELVNLRKNGASGGARARNKKSRILVIEQPELHLHPALQYRFGLAIAKVASLAERENFSIVVETHSKHLIDALGASVRSKVLPESSINIVLFEKENTQSTSISFSGFDEDGYLLDWPAGFLSA